MHRLIWLKHKTITFSLAVTWAKNSQNLVDSSSTSSLLFQMQNIRFQSSGMRRKQVALKMTLVVWHFVFFPPLYLSFSCPIFFFCCKFSRLLFGGKGVWESFNGRRIWCKEVHVSSETRFSWDFLGQLRALFCCCCCFAFSPTSLIESRSFWHGMKDIFSLHKSDEEPDDKDVLDRF